MLVYADSTDLATWDGTLDIPSDIDALLRSASILVARAVNESLYSDPPPPVTDPKRDATCAQVAAWITTGIRPASGGLSNTSLLKRKQIEGASTEYDTSLSASVTAFEARRDIANQLCEEAEAILFQAGILWVPLPEWSDDSDDCSPLAQHRWS